MCVFVCVCMWVGFTALIGEIVQIVVVGICAIFWCKTLVPYLGVYVLVFIDLCVILMLTVVCLNMCAVNELSIVFSQIPKTNFS